LDIPLRQAAEELGLRPATLRMQARLGRIKVQRHGGREIFVDTTEVERYRREHLRQTTQSA
jgi:predicted site-specific integrase-resolvase